MLKINALEIKDDIDKDIIASALRSSMTYCLDVLGACIVQKKVSRLHDNLDRLYRIEELYFNLTGSSFDNSFRLNNLIEYAKRENIVWPISIKQTFYWSQYGS